MDKELKKLKENYQKMEELQVAYDCGVKVKGNKAVFPIPKNSKSRKEAVLHIAYTLSKKYDLELDSQRGMLGSGKLILTSPTDSFPLEKDYIEQLIRNRMGFGGPFSE